MHLSDRQARVACISAALNMKQGSYYVRPLTPSYSLTEVIRKQCLLITAAQLSGPSPSLPARLSPRDALGLALSGIS